MSQPRAERAGSGVRISLRLVRVEPDRVLYAFDLKVPEHTWQGEAQVGIAGGEVRIPAAVDLAQAPPWTVALLHRLLRGVWRSSPTEGWPRRLARWRAEPARSRPGAEEHDGS